MTVPMFTRSRSVKKYIKQRRPRTLLVARKKLACVSRYHVPFSGRNQVRWTGKK